ncbi:uncharacterized protein LOC143460663 isoform X1 [Clavelina lepadiformis]|uniref:uncharacterized protein LOC143460663 isoform X1 n=1 Tax=Clavelina lepadiformis TaxID=159417 RepID=UPI004042CA65
MWSKYLNRQEEKASPHLGDEKSEEAKWVPFKPGRDSSQEKIRPTEDVSKTEKESHEQELETIDIVILNWHEPDEVPKAATPTKDDIDFTYSLKHDEQSPVPFDQQKESSPKFQEMAENLSPKIPGGTEPATSIPAKDSLDYFADAVKLEVESLKRKFRAMFGIDVLNDDESEYLQRQEEKASSPFADEKSEEAKWVPCKPRKDSSPEKIPPTEDVSKTEKDSHEQGLETIDIVILNWHEPDEVPKAATPTKDDIDFTYSLKHDEQSPVPFDQQKESSPKFQEMAENFSPKIPGGTEPATSIPAKDSLDYFADAVKLEVESLKRKFRAMFSIDVLNDDESEYLQRQEEKASSPFADEKSEEAKWVPCKPRKDSSPEKIPPTEDVSKTEKDSHEQGLETIDIVILNWHEPDEVSKAATPTKDDSDLTYSLKHDEQSPVPFDQQKESSPKLQEMVENLSPKIPGGRESATSTPAKANLDNSADAVKLEVESFKRKFRAMFSSIDVLNDDESED